MQINVTFESIAELDEFVARLGLPAAQVVSYVAPALSPVVIDAFSDAIAPDEAQTPEQAASEVVTAAQEKPKRTRRTKAEIETARAAESAPVEDAPSAPGDEAATPAPIVNEGNPFASAAPAANAAIQAALAGASNDQTLAALAEVQVPAAVVAKSAKPTDPEHIKTWLHDTAVGNIGPLEMGAHMARAKAFIAKNGNAKYNETFVVAGLDPNIMVYTDEQRAYHAAALEFVDWS